MRSLAIRLYYAMITEADLVKVVQAIDRQDIMQVHEFATVLDQRELPATVGLLVEITGDLGMTVTLCMVRSTILMWPRSQRSALQMEGI